MASGNRSTLAARLGTLWTVGTVGETDDQGLLSRFAEGRDEAADEAFRILVERHGPTVLRICEQVIGNCQDAEDAFSDSQAAAMRLESRWPSAVKAGSVFSIGNHYRQEGFKPLFLTGRIDIMKTG